jgi:preprotein translocase subunit SecE
VGRPGLATARREEPDSAPDPLLHATPDAELAEAQMALGRPDLAAETEPEGPDDEQELDDGGDGGDRPPSAPDFDSEDVGGGPPSGGGGELAVPGGAAAAHRPRGIGRLIGFIQGSWRELQRVQWPDRRQVMQATGVVIGFVIVAGAYLGVADFLAGKLVNFILK